VKKSNKKFELAVESYGLYSRWDRSSKDLPDIVKFTNHIPAEIDNEFGMILRIKKGKGIKLNFRITHPPFMDNDGNQSPDFTGEHLITSNDYLFFIGDCIWKPVEDKKGIWGIEIFQKDKLLVRKEFFVE